MGFGPRQVGECRAKSHAPTVVTMHQCALSALWPRPGGVGQPKAPAWAWTAGPGLPSHCGIRPVGDLSE
jgi:hypothetical protein